MTEDTAYWDKVDKVDKIHFEWREHSATLTDVPVIGDTRACPDCSRPQHYTGIEAGWSHDAGWAHVDLTDTWHCNDPRKAGA